MTQPRPMTAEEMRDAMFEHMAAVLRYWRDLPVSQLMAHQKPDRTETECRMEGLLFSLLVMFDGLTLDSPAFDIVPAPHADDEEYRRGEGENWWVATTINDVALHEIFPWEKCR